MALKKRGYNVDRILNRQREDRLRLRAEAVRDREKAIEQETQNRQSQSQSIGQIQDQPPPAYDDGRRRSSVSVSGKSAAGASTDSSESRKLGLLERLRKGKSSRNLDQPEAGWDEGKRGILAELERLKAGGIERDANGRIHGMDGPSGGPSNGGGFTATRPAVHTARVSTERRDHFCEAVDLSDTCPAQRSRQYPIDRPTGTRRISSGDQHADQRLASGSDERPREPGYLLRFDRAGEFDPRCGGWAGLVGDLDPQG
jgi:hypothetical protein